MSQLLAVFLVVVPSLAAQAGPLPPLTSVRDVPATTFFRQQYGTPKAGVEKVNPQVPDWCDGYEVGQRVDLFGDPMELAGSEMASGFSGRSIFLLARAACDAPQNSTRQEWVALWRQVWMNATKLSAAQTRDWMAWTLRRGPALRSMDAPGGSTSTLQPPRDCSRSSEVRGPLTRAQFDEILNPVSNGLKGATVWERLESWFRAEGLRGHTVVYLAWLRCQEQSPASNAWTHRLTQVLADDGGVSPEQMQEIVAVAAVAAGDLLRGAACSEPPKVTDAVEVRARAAVSSCGPMPSAAELRFALDTAELFGAPPNEFMRAAYVLSIDGDAKTAVSREVFKTRLARIDAFPLGLYGAVGHDMRSLDWERFKAALAAEGFSPSARFNSLVIFTRAKVWSDALERRFRAEASKRFDARLIAFEAPEDGMRRFNEEVSQAREVLSVASSVEAAFARHDVAGLAGCREKLRGLLSSLVAPGLGAKATRAEVHARLNTDVNAALMSALALCQLGEGDRIGAVVVARELDHWMACRRGPRLAGIANIQSRAVDMVDGVARSNVLDIVKRTSGCGPGGPRAVVDAEVKEPGIQDAGVIAAVTPQADGVLVSFSTETLREPVESCTLTDRIKRIEKDGYLIYEEDCRVVGQKNRKRDIAPVLLPLADQGLLQTGQVLTFLAFRDVVTGKRVGSSLTVAASGKSSKPLSVCGVAISDSKKAK